MQKREEEVASRGMEGFIHRENQGHSQQHSAGAPSLEGKSVYLLLLTGPY